MLQLDSVTAGYGSQPVVTGVSLDVQPGETVTVIGGNGAGKTTTLRAISGLVKLSGGTIRFMGESIGGLPSHEIVNRGIVMIPEARQLFPSLTVKDNLLMGAFNPAARATYRRTLAEVLGLFPRLVERLTYFAGSLSGGEQQMVAIARGLMARPKLLMIDEPSLGLAPLIVKQVFEIVQAVARSGTTVLIVEQNIAQTLGIADRGYVLENGAIVQTGASGDLLRDDHVRKAYLGI